METENILRSVDQYYTDKIKQFGPVFKGVDWSSEESQFIRFKQLLKVCDFSSRFYINDYGCGYGALYNYMINKKYDIHYYGYDISREMISAAKNLHKDRNNCTFFYKESDLCNADYTVASGIFNVKQEIADREWQKYVVSVLNILNQLSKRGFSFNILTKYSDKEFMKDYLYYADPCYYFDYCKKNFSRNVSLLHDYELYEFTIIVKK